MSLSLDVEISITESSRENILWLHDLNEDLQKKLQLVTEPEIVEGTADSLSESIMIAIGITGVSLSTLNLLFNVLKFHIQQRNSEIVTISDPESGIVRQISNLTSDKAKEIIEEAEQKSQRKLLIKVLER